jgi:hypothetical protein
VRRVLAATLLAPMSLVLGSSCGDTSVPEPRKADPCPDLVTVGVGVGHSSAIGSGGMSAGGSSAGGSGGASSGACSCDDGDACTDDSTDPKGHCHHLWKASCGANPCDDGDDCSTDSPWISVPSPSPPTCCRRDYECNTNSTELFCVTAPGIDQCEGGHVCDDADPCTVDMQGPNGCEHSDRCKTAADYPCY